MKVKATLLLIIALFIACSTVDERNAMVVSENNDFNMYIVSVETNLSCFVLMCCQ